MGTAGWLIYLAVDIGLIVLMFYIGYRIIKRAVREGILEAHDKMEKSKGNDQTLN